MPESDSWTFRVEGSSTLEEARVDTTEPEPSVPAQSPPTLVEPTETVPPMTVVGPDTTGGVRVETTTTVPGFRVQIFSASDSSRARMVADEARVRLKEETYVDPSDGLFRVRAGNCLTRGEAETFREKCRVAGYMDAFIVTARITVVRSP